MTLLVACIKIANYWQFGKLTRLEELWKGVKEMMEDAVLLKSVLVANLVHSVLA